MITVGYVIASVFAASVLTFCYLAWIAVDGGDGGDKYDY